MSSLQDRHSRTLSNLKHQDHSPQVVIPQYDLRSYAGPTTRLLPPALPLILRPHIMQDHLYLSPPLPRNPTNTYYSALPFPWPKFNSDSGHCTTSYGKAWRSSRPQDLSPYICYGSSFPRPPPPSATQTHAGPTGPLSLHLPWVFLPPTPSTQHCTAPCRAHICSALYSGSSDGTYWILPTFLHVWSKLAAIPKPPHQSLGPLYASLASLHARPSAIQLGLRLSPSSPRKASILGAEMGNKQRT